MKVALQNNEMFANAFPFTDGRWAVIYKREFANGPLDVFCFEPELRCKLNISFNKINKFASFLNFSIDVYLKLKLLYLERITEG